MRYVAAVGFAIVALGIRLSLQPALGDRVGYATFYAAVACAAVLCGPGPACMAAVLGGVAAFLAGGQPLDLEALAALALFFSVSGLLVVLSEKQRRSISRAEAETALRERSEAAERQQRQWFEVTLASIGDAVIATGADGRVTFMNEMAAALTEWRREQVAGSPVEEVFRIYDEETGAPLENPIVRALRAGAAVTPAHRAVLLSRHGRRIPIDDSGAPIAGPGGQTTGAVLVFRDATEARARDSELRHRDRMIDSAHDAIIVTDADRRIKRWNRGAVELYGYSEEEAQGRVVSDLLRTRGPLPLESIDSALAEFGRWDGHLIHTCKDGARVVSESRRILLRGAGGGIAGILEINRDVTKRRRAERRLRRTAALAKEGRRTLEALLEHIPEGIALTDAAGNLRAVSAYGRRMAGWSNPVPPDAMEQDAWSLFHLDGLRRASRDELPLHRALGGDVINGEEWLFRRTDGSHVPILCSAAPIRDAEKRVTGALLAWRDISNRKRLEHKLREAAKLESLGVLAGGIAHDFNNLLTGILGNASILLDEAPEGSLASSCAKSLTRSAERAAQLTQQMLAYSGRGRFVIKHINLSALIEETATLLRTSIPGHIELRMLLSDDLPLVEADVAQLQQVVVNLIINGVEAIGPSGGQVTVATRVESIDDTYIRTLPVSEGIPPGEYVVLEVQDTGSGMDHTVVSRIFDPFFTTKFTGRGLGLAAVQGIVRGHRGAIKVYSAPGAGTLFRVMLPVLHATPEPASFSR